MMNIRILKEQICNQCRDTLQTKSNNPRQWVCNSCRDKNTKIRTKKSHKKWRVENKDYLDKKRKEYYEQNRETFLNYNREYYEQHADAIKKQTKEYYEQNREKMIDWQTDYNKEYVKENRESIRKRVKQYNKEYYKDNKEVLHKGVKAWVANNRERIRKRLSDKYHNDVEYKILHMCRQRLTGALKRKNCVRSKHTKELIGCSLPELKLHLEKQFKPGMSWDNHGYGEEKWHIDHIKPCDSFDLTIPEEQQKCFHYSNLQPLWQKENLLKSNKEIK